jgi:hypothetical protein
MSICFILELRKDDWKENVNGWSCPALTIPGATLEALYASGQVNSTWYQVDTRVGLIKWLREGRPPASATAQIALTKELEDREVSSLWKKLAILLPAVASIIVALVTAYFAHPPISPTPHQNCSLWTVAGAVALGDLTRYQVATTIKPPDTDLNDDGSFQFTIPVETRSDGSASPPTIIFSPRLGGYKPAVVHPDNYASDGHRIRIPTPIAIEKAPGTGTPERNRS